MSIWAMEPDHADTDMVAALPIEVRRMLAIEITAAASGHESDSFLLRVVSEAVDAFVRAHGAPKVAAARVARDLRVLGIQQPGLGTDHDLLAQAFERASQAALVGVRRALGTDVHGDPLADVLSRVAEYMRLLQGHARAGLTQAERLLSVPEEDRRKQLRRALFGSGEPIDALALLTGHDPAALYVAVISVRAPLPDALTHDPTVFLGTPVEALVPAGQAAESLADVLTDQAVVSPPTPLEQCTEAIDLTRRAAMLLRSGVIKRSRTVVSGADLIGPTMLGGHRLLGEWAVQRHLGELGAMKEPRRSDYAVLLLTWLERGQPLSHIAQVLDVPAQTAHHRFHAIRTLFGDRLDNPLTRLELIVALRTVLPHWRAQRKQ
jgi:hypothetical protein